MTYYHPPSRYFGPPWFRFGWAQSVNGLGRPVRDNFVVSLPRWRLRITIEVDKR